MIHLIKNSKNGIDGIGVLSYANKTLKLAKLTESAASDYFGSGCHVAGILSTDSPRLTKEQREAIRQSWNDAHGSTAGTGMAVLEAGMKYQPVSSNSRDAQMIESRLYNLQDIARFFNINPVLLGDLSHSSYSTIEASLLEFVIHTLAPYITLMQEEFTRKLIKPSEKGLYVDFDENAILKSDKSSQATYLSTLVSNGIMTPNEARQQLGLNAIDGCDDLIIPFTDLSQNKVNGNKENTSKAKEEDEGNE
jgi:HK97 family phage portal protein